MHIYTNPPPTTPTKKYKPSTVLQKDAEMSPAPARQPPAIMIGRLPYLFTRILLIGPVDNEKKIYLLYLNVLFINTDR